MLETDLLRTFVAIADSGSFTEAARRVHRTQSAVSMQMKRLEETVGRSLFQRAGRTVHLTPDGERLLAHARPLLRLHREVSDLFEDDRLDGTVTLGVSDLHAATVLPPVLARFADTHPCAHVEVVCDTPAGLRTRLEDGGIDLALLSGTDNGGTVLWREPLVWATSPRHDAHRREPVPLAAFHHGCRFRREALDALARVGRACHVAYTSVSLAGILAAVTSGLAVCVLPRSCLTGLRELGETDGFPPLIDITVTLARGDAESPLVSALARHITEDLSVPPGPPAHARRASAA